MRDMRDGTTREVQFTLRAERDLQYEGRNPCGRAAKGSGGSEYVL